MAAAITILPGGQAFVQHDQFFGGVFEETARNSERQPRAIRASGSDV